MLWGRCPLWSLCPGAAPDSGCPRSLGGPQAQWPWVFPCRFWWQKEGRVQQAAAAGWQDLHLPRIICDNTGITVVSKNSIFMSNTFPGLCPLQVVSALDLAPWRKRARGRVRGAAGK